MYWDGCPQALAGRIFECANSKDKSLTVDCVRCSEDERGHNERDEGAQVP